MPGVVLVTMPFGGFRQPSLALGLLKAALKPLDVTVIDATLDFAAMVSPEVYDTIAGWPAVDLLGDRVFAAWLPEPPPQPWEEYEEQVLAGGAPEHAVPYFGKRPLDAGFRADLRAAEVQAGELLDRCLAEIAAVQPAVVGFTSMSGQHAASLALAGRVKAACPDAFVVFGGASCRGEMGAELVRSFPCVDGVVDGEGEEALPELVRRRVAGEPPAGVPGVRLASEARGEQAGVDVAGGGGEGAPRDAAPALDLDRVPTPDFDDYFARLAASPLRDTFAPRIPFETSRGCWWGEKSRCTFCGQASASLAYRTKSAPRALAELEGLVRRYSASSIFVTDEIVPPDYLDDVFPALHARLPGVDIVYLQVRPTLDRRQLATLVGAGVRRVEAGIESLSTSTLRRMRKGTTALAGVQFLKCARAVGLDVVWNLLWGLPGEDPGEYERMARLVPLLSHLQPPHTVGAFRLDRFSPMFEDPARYGLDDVRPYPACGYVYRLDAAALSRLAYSFCFADASPSRVGEATAPLAAAVARWKESFTQSALTFVDDGATLTLSDRRPGFDPDELTVLDGEHRALYRACDDVQTAGALAKLLARETGRDVDAGEVDEALAPLVHDGLMLREGGSYLALGLPRDAAAGEDPA